MSLAIVVRSTLNRLQQEHEPITPDSFARVFCQEAKKIGVTVGECERLERFMAKLAPPIAKMAAEYHIANLDEFLTFLVAQANRQQPNRKELSENNLIDLTRRILTAIHKWPDPHLRKEAAFTLSRDLTHPAILQDERKRWTRISTEMEFGFLDQLDKHGVFSKGDLFTLIGEIDAHLDAQERPDDLRSVATLIVEVLSPGLEPRSRERLEKIGQELESNPGLITAAGMQEEIRELAGHRLLDQTEILQERTGLLKTLMEGLQDELRTQAGGNQALIDEADKLLGEGGDNQNTLSQRLMTLFKEASRSLHGFSGSLQKRIEDTTAMQEEITTLKNELNTVKSLMMQDSVTGVLSRRALAQTLDSVEKEWSAEKHNYGLLFLKIDRFDELTDNLGRDSGEAVLTVVARHLNQHLEGKAKLGRYGGSTFLLIAHTHSIAPLMRLAEDLCAKAHRQRFVYEKQSFQITLSGGIALRSQHNSLKNTLNHADAALRTARLGGGHQIK